MLVVMQWKGRKIWMMRCTTRDTAGWRMTKGGGRGSLNDVRSAFFILIL